MMCCACVRGVDKESRKRDLPTRKTVDLSTEQPTSTHCETTPEGPLISSTPTRRKISGIKQKGRKKTLRHSKHISIVEPLMTFPYPFHFLIISCCAFCFVWPNSYYNISFLLLMYVFVCSPHRNVIQLFQSRLKCRKNKMLSVQHRHKGGERK